MQKVFSQNGQLLIKRTNDDIFLTKIKLCEAGFCAMGFSRPGITARLFFSLFACDFPAEKNLNP